MAGTWAKFGSAFDQGALRPSCLGFAAVVATLPVYEPALHSFHTIAPDTFDQGVAPYTLAAFAAMFVCAFTMLGLYALERRNRQRSANTNKWRNTGPGRQEHPIPGAASSLRAPRPHEARFKIAMAACCLLGALGLCLLAGFTMPAALAAALGAFAGAGSALLLMAWGEVFRACTKKAALMHLAITGVLGAFLLNMVGTLPYAFAVPLFGALEIVALAVPVFELGREQSVVAATPGTPAATTIPSDATTAAAPVPTAAAGAPAEAAEKPAPLAVHLAEPLLGIALFAMSFQVLGAHTVYLFYLSFLLGSIVAGVAVLPVLFLDSKRPLMALLYEIVLPLAGFAVVAATIAVPDALQAITTRNGFMVFYSFAILLFLSSTIAFANAGEYEPQRVFAAAVASFAGASLAGIAVGAIASESVCNDAFCVLTFIYLIFLALRPNVEAWRHPQVAPGCEARTILAGHRTGEFAGGLANERTDGRTDGLADGLACGSACGLVCGVAGEKDGAWGFSDGMANSAGRAPYGAGGPAGDMWPGAANVVLDDATLARIARRWGLTGRELEILPLLVQGRTSTYIARTLYISDSTARGHAHKIYQKAGVSTREGLLAVLADNRESDASFDEGQNGGRGEDRMAGYAERMG